MGTSNACKEFVRQISTKDKTWAHYFLVFGIFPESKKESEQGQKNGTQKGETTNLASSTTNLIKRKKNTKMIRCDAKKTTHEPGPLVGP